MLDWSMIITLEWFTLTASLCLVFSYLCSQCSSCTSWVWERPMGRSACWGWLKTPFQTTCLQDAHAMLRPSKQEKPSVPEPSSQRMVLLWWLLEHLHMERWVCPHTYLISGSQTSTQSLRLDQWFSQHRCEAKMSTAWETLRIGLRTTLLDLLNTSMLKCSHE